MEAGVNKIGIYISYAHGDEPLLKKLIEHLSSMRQSNLITHWHDGDISAGQQWTTEINEHLNVTTQVSSRLAKGEETS
jgi:hypothetical protein